MSNPNGLLSQKLCHYLNQGRTLNGILLRAAQWLNLILEQTKFSKLMYWRRSNPNCNGNIRDKVTLKTTCIKNVELKIVKIKTGCQYKGYFNYCENLNRAAQNLPLGNMRPTGRGLDTAGLRVIVKFVWSQLLSEYNQIARGNRSPSHDFNCVLATFFYHHCHR